MTKEPRTVKELTEIMFVIRNKIRAVFIGKYADRTQERRLRWRAITRRLGLFISLGTGYCAPSDCHADLGWLKKIQAELDAEAKAETDAEQTK